MYSHLSILHSNLSLVGSGCIVGYWLTVDPYAVQLLSVAFDDLFYHCTLIPLACLSHAAGRVSVGS